MRLERQVDAPDITRDEREQQAARSLDEVRNGRGMQFRPDVVDAFLVVAESLPVPVTGVPPRRPRPLAAAGWASGD